MAGIISLETSVSLAAGYGRMTASVRDADDVLLAEHHGPTSTNPLLSSLEAAVWGLQLVARRGDTEVVHWVDSQALADRLSRAPRPGDQGGELVNAYRSLAGRIGRVRVLKHPHAGLQDFVARKAAESVDGVVG
jgi:hypothetical protein